MSKVESREETGCERADEESGIIQAEEEVVAPAARRWLLLIRLLCWIGLFDVV
jgi:hypothetical protein